MGKRKLTTLWLLVALFTFSGFEGSAQCDRERDSLVLVEIHQSNPQSQGLLNWDLAGTPIDAWPGITVDGIGCVSGLALNDMSLNILPDAIGNLKSLRTLELYRNDLVEIPETIGGLDGLRKLIIWQNRIIQIPDGVRNLILLEELDLGGNSISVIPDFIGELVRLKKLILPENHIKRIPSSIGALKELEDLQLWRNEISELPEAVGELEALRKLIIWSNDIAEVPDAIGRLTRLESIDMGANKISVIPDNLRNLTNLREFIFPVNELTVLPDFIGELTDLTKLHVWSNQLTGLPNTIGSLVNLEILDIAGNNLTEVPVIIANLDNLKVLGLSRNKIKEIPIPTGALRNLLTRLEVIDLGNNELIYLPEAVGELQSLRELYLSRNHLQDLPASLGDAERLDRLVIHDNQLTFEDVRQVSELKPGLSIFYYAPQNKIYKDTILYFQKGENAMIPLEVDPTMTDNEYRWIKDKVSYDPDPLNSIHSNTLIIPEVDLGDVGNYEATVRNPNYPDLTLESLPVGIRVCDRENDSLELVRLFNATNGSAWADKSNWLVPGVPIQTWYGITTDPFGCVNKIDLTDNQLAGELPGLALNTLDTLILKDNLLTGGIPADIFIPYIRYVDISNNRMSGPIPMVTTSWMQITNLDIGNNVFRGSIPPELGDLCELEELNLDGNGFEGQIPTELTMLFNLKKGQVSFANNQISNMEQEWIYFCPFGIEIMSNNPGGFERFVEICGDTCSGVEFSRIEDHPWLIDRISKLDCEGFGCHDRIVRSDAGFVVVRGVTVAYTRTRCYIDLDDYDETIHFYDCGGYLLDIYNCRSDELCSGLAVISPDEFSKLQFDSRWNCSCNNFICTPADTIVIDEGEIDTLFAEEFVSFPEDCNTSFYRITSVNNTLPGSPPVATMDNIGYTYELLIENLLSGTQCTTTIEVVRGVTGRNEYPDQRSNGVVLINCYPNPVVDFLSCPEIDVSRVERSRVYNLHGMEMPVRMEKTGDSYQLNVLGYPPGMYILVVRGSEGQFVNRFTVIR